MMRKIINQVFSWVMAMIVACIIMNFVVMAFYHPGISIPTSNASALGKLLPNRWCLYGDEGWGIEYTDSRGFVNQNDELGSSYILAVGSSHTEGFHTPAGKRWSDLLGQELKSQDTVVYNIASSGYQFPDIAKRITAISQEFPNSQMLIIEIGGVTFTSESFVDAMDQIEFDESQTIQALIDNMSGMTKIKNHIKENLVLFRWIRKQVIVTMERQLRPEAADEIGVESAEFDVEYQTRLARLLEKMKDIYPGELVIVNHPGVGLNHDGQLIVGKGLYDDIFASECKKAGILYVDCSDAFMEEYQKNQNVPNGFWNTTMCSGHINSTGHKVIAEELKNALWEEEK